MAQPASDKGPQLEPIGQPRRRLARDSVIVGSILAATTLAFWVAFGTASTFVFLPLALTVVFGATLSTVKGLVASAIVAAAMTGAYVLLSDPDACCFHGAFVPVVVAGVLIFIMLAWFGGAVVGWAWRSITGR